MSLVLIVGGGPSGLYAAEVLAEAGHEVVMLNRDVKPGGLVEYGVFPTKHNFKEGLRKQFKKTLQRPNVHYRGDVRVGEGGAFTVEELAARFDAAVVAVGAQGTSWLGMPGERGGRVYHAKDLVYHYNRLPPFAAGSYPMGKRVAIVGVGNVMVDIAHWQVRFGAAEEIVALSRTTPRFRKYTPKEIKLMGDAIDVEGMRAEIEAVREHLLAVGDDPDAELAELLKYATPEGERAQARWRVRWLVSPIEVVLDEDGQCAGLRVQPLRAIGRGVGERPKVEPLGEPEVMDVDTVVFAVGDAVDASLGLPLGRAGFRTAAEVGAEGEDAPYQLVGPDGQTPWRRWYAAGWAREPSSGLVGQARKDSTEVARRVVAALRSAEQDRGADAARREAFDAELSQRGCRRIDYALIQRLEAVERERAAGTDPFEGKLRTNAEMFAAMGLDHEG